MRKLLLSLMFLTSGYAQEIYATFTVEAKQSANLAFTSSGIVDKVYVDVGSVVKKDETIAKLDNEDMKAFLTIATTTLKYAKKAYDRQLSVKNLVDASKLDSFASAYEGAKAQVAYQKALLDKTMLKAPFEGVIYEKMVEVGDAVSGAMLRTILKIQTLSERKLVLSFDQKYWKEVKVGETFSYKVDGDETQYQGKITKLYPVANTANRKLIAEVEAKDFVVGLFGEGYINVSK